MFLASLCTCIPVKIYQSVEAQESSWFSSHCCGFYCTLQLQLWFWDTIGINLDNNPLGQAKCTGQVSCYFLLLHISAHPQTSWRLFFLNQEPTAPATSAFLELIKFGPREKLESLFGKNKKTKNTKRIAKKTPQEPQWSVNIVMLSKIYL